MVKVEMTKTQQKYINDRSRELLIEGSAGSGKTTFACYKTILYALQNENASVYVYRVTLPSLKRTSWKEIRNILFDLKVPYYENKSEGVISFDNGSTIYFGALDELSKIRSINADMIYIEQAEELKNPDFYVELMLRLGRGEASKRKGGYAQMLMVVQPENTEHWIYQRYHEFNDVAEELDDITGDVIRTYDEVLEDTKKERTIAHFHYSENLKLPMANRKYYDNLKNENYDAWLRYSAGKWGKLTGVVYNHWDIIEGDLPAIEKYTFGIDFGYNNPACFLLIGWNDSEAYIIDEVYGSEMLNTEFIEESTQMIFKHKLLPSHLYSGFADSANPDKIREFESAGFPVLPSVKDVTAKVDATKQTKIHIHPRCIHTIEEIKGYVYKTNRNGAIQEEPVKENDHAMDALAYCVYGIRGALSPNKPIDDKKFYNQIRVY